MTCESRDLSANPQQHLPTFRTPVSNIVIDHGISFGMLECSFPTPQPTMIRNFFLPTLFIAWTGASSLVMAAPQDTEERRVPVFPTNVVTESSVGNAEGLVDEQDLIIGPPVGKPSSNWTIPSQNWKDHKSFSAHIDLGSPRKLSRMYLFDTNGEGAITIETGSPDQWELLTEARTDKYMQWREIPIDRETQFVRITVHDQGANFNEVAFYEYTPEAFAAMQAKKAEEARLAAEREAALAKALEEMKKRPLVDVGPPFGELYLIDEIDAAEQEPLVQSPEGVSKVETILGRKARVLPKTDAEGAYFAYRLGQMKLLEPGMTYVLQVEYPEDKPRMMVVMNGGSETSRGFHTGSTIGDALHPKYVNNLAEALNVPLSGEWESWTQMFNLHDRMPELGFIRGDEPKRVLTPEDGITVTISQWSAKNMPESAGAAVSKIRLLAVPEPEKLKAQYNLPEGLPHRNLFWREEMADMVMNIGKDDLQATKEPLDWWRYKRNLMQFLGMNTYTKDLLEFGAVQHWDTTEYGGNKWAFFNNDAKGVWGGIVEMMGEAGFNVLPYYEYSGSKGQDGLGNKKMARPLTRDEGFTHIKWIESANVDITQPEAYEDFKKMLDLTIIRHKDKANFAGAWIRPRGQMPMSFSEAALKLFAKEANDGKAITRQQLIDDKPLYEKYKTWWFGKRKQFLAAMRDHLRENGIDDASVIFTTEPGEPGGRWRSFGTRLVTDEPEKWKKIVSGEEHKTGEDSVEVLTVDKVVDESLYLDALINPPATWGGWEIHHGSPEHDPATYKDDEGLMLGIPFNRLYTVADPDLFDTFRNESGLTIIRHYSLNENMMFDADDKNKLGYFIADIERTGPYSMMAEAVAMATGDPTNIGYLSGGNFARGFPEYARNFNTAFLSLPALPSQRIPNAASDEDVVVRKIETDGKGTYLSVVNIGMTDKPNVEITMPSSGKVIDAASGEEVPVADGKVKLSFYPYQLRALKITK